MAKLTITLYKGGAGSGHHGHGGRPGKVGGSVPDGGGGNAETELKKRPFEGKKYEGWGNISKGKGGSYKTMQRSKGVGEDRKTVIIEDNKHYGSGPGTRTSTGRYTVIGFHTKVGRSYKMDSTDDLDKAVKMGNNYLGV